MFKKILNIFDKVPTDSLLDRIEKQPITSKYYRAISLTLISLIVLIIFEIFVIYFKSKPNPAHVYSVVRSNGIIDKNTIKPVPVTLPFAHQSFKNIVNWLNDAIIASYTFDFLNFYKNVYGAEFYYTPDGFNAYVNALKSSGLEKDIIGKKLIASIVPLKSPALLSSGMYSTGEFWKFSVPVLINYSGGTNKPFNSKYLLEVTVVKVPAYISHKGLAISNFSMLPM